MVNFLTKIKEFDFYLKYSECSSHSHNLFGEIWRKNGSKMAEKRPHWKGKKAGNGKEKKKKILRRDDEQYPGGTVHAPPRARAVHARVWIKMGRVSRPAWFDPRSRLCMSVTYPYRLLACASACNPKKNYFNHKKKAWVG